MLARALMHRSGEGKHYGVLTAKFLGAPSGRYKFPTLRFRRGHANHQRSPSNGGLEVASAI